MNRSLMFNQACELKGVTSECEQHSIGEGYEVNNGEDVPKEGVPIR